MTYNPDKHKQKEIKQMRLNLRRKPSPPTKQKCPPPTTMKFGSMNVNGLDLEAGWAVQQLLKNRGFNVSNLKIGNYMYFICFMNNSNQIQNTKVTIMYSPRCWL